jgi:hypothetical protein
VPKPLTKDLQPVTMWRSNARVICISTHGGVWWLALLPRCRCRRHGVDPRTCRARWKSTRRWHPLSTAGCRSCCASASPTHARPRARSRSCTAGARTMSRCADRHAVAHRASPTPRVHTLSSTPSRPRPLLYPRSHPCSQRPHLEELMTNSVDDFAYAKLVQNALPTLRLIPSFTPNHSHFPSQVPQVQPHRAAHRPPQAGQPQKNDANGQGAQQERLEADEDRRLREAEARRVDGRLL